MTTALLVSLRSPQQQPLWLQLAKDIQTTLQAVTDSRDQVVDDTTVKHVESQLSTLSTLVQYTQAFVGNYRALMRGDLAHGIQAHPAKEQCLGELNAIEAQVLQMQAAKHELRNRLGIHRHYTLHPTNSCTWESLNNEIQALLQASVAVHPLVLNEEALPWLITLQQGLENALEGSIAFLHRATQAQRKIEKDGGSLSLGERSHFLHHTLTIQVSSMQLGQALREVYDKRLFHDKLQPATLAERSTDASPKAQTPSQEGLP